MPSRSRRGWWAIVALILFSTAACGLNALGGAPEERADGGPLPSGSEGGDSALDGGGAEAESGLGDGGEVVLDGSAPIALDDAGCPSGRGPAMLRLFGASSLALCIDETEVSARQYQPFMLDFASGRVPPQIAECAANNTVLPFDPVSGTMPPLNTDDPVDRIDQCDARLFCEWAGKHLCRRRDGTDTLVNQNDSDDAAISEWFAACSQDGASTSVPAQANLQSNTIPGRNADGQVPVSASPPGGPTYAGRVLRHIVGNVEEWADGCDGTGSCAARGASVKTTGSTDCRTRTLHPRMERRADLGFRCCATPAP